MSAAASITAQASGNENVESACFSEACQANSSGAAKCERLKEQRAIDRSDEGKPLRDSNQKKQLDSRKQKLQTHAADIASLPPCTQAASSPRADCAHKDCSVRLGAIAIISAKPCSTVLRSDANSLSCAGFPVPTAHTKKSGTFEWSGGKLAPTTLTVCARR